MSPFDCTVGAATDFEDLPRTRLRPDSLLLVVVLASVVATACGKDEGGTEPVTAASVEVTSPLGSLIDVGTTTPLSATARDGSGAAMSGISFTWASSSPAVVSVDGTGFIEALGVGTSAVAATGAGRTGTLDLRVVDADVEMITLLSTDPLVDAIVATSSASVRASLEAAVDQCVTGADDGRLDSIVECMADFRAEAANASDPTDRVLVAALGLLIDRVEALLHL